uniref:Large ribosomal subunit protein uL11m n=1 Tax=Strigops habroptila TaxID=2489341 RepID=A0A672V6S4_STRHB
MSKAARVVRAVRGAGAGPEPRPLRALIPAGGAAPGPPLGPLLGQVRDFNERTRTSRPGSLPEYHHPLPQGTGITPLRPEHRAPPASYFLKAAAGVERGAAQPGESGGVVSLKHLYEVALVKQKDPAVALRGMSLPQLVTALVGSARSLGLRVVVPLPTLSKHRSAPTPQQPPPSLGAPHPTPLNH